MNILFDNIYKYIKEIKLFDKDINIDKIITNIKCFWHNILLTTFPFVTITSINHNNIKTNYYQTLIKYQDNYKGVQFDTFISDYKDKETDYLVSNLDTIMLNSYSLNNIIDTFQNICKNNDDNLPIDKIMKYIYKIPINDIEELLISLEEIFLIDYKEICNIYMNYYKNYKNYSISSPLDKIKMFALSNLYMKEYISTNNINYSILSIIVKELTSPIGTFDFLDKNLEKEIEIFLKPFKMFINYINKDNEIDDKDFDLLSIDDKKMISLALN